MLYYISIQIPCLPWNDSMTVKMETLSYSCRIVTRACLNIVIYLFAARQARANYVTLHNRKLHFDEKFKYLLDSLLCHNLFSEL